MTAHRICSIRDFYADLVVFSARTSPTSHFISSNPCAFHLCVFTMRVHVNRRLRSTEDPLLNPLSIRQHIMVDDGREDVKLVLSIRGTTLLELLSVLYQYAVLDKIGLLPILTIINSIAIFNLLHEFRHFWV